MRVEVGRVMQESALIFRSLSQAPLGYGDGGMSTTQELEACQKTVLSPYLYFLKLVSEVTDTVSGAVVSKSHSRVLIAGLGMRLYFAIFVYVVCVYAYCM